MFKHLHTQLNLLFICILGVFSGCIKTESDAQNTQSYSAEGKTPIRIVSTTGMIGDCVRQIAGDRAESIVLMAPGVDPHGYKPTPKDVDLLRKADVIFYNGLKLEGKMDDLFRSLSQSGKRVVAVTAGIPTEALLKSHDSDALYDPHVWLDVSLWAKTVPIIVETLLQIDPAGADYYKEQEQRILAQFEALDQWCRETAASLPDEKRILITSHDAFNYFGRAYNFQVIGLQGVSTVSEASIADFVRLVNFIKEHNIKAIFEESSVNPQAIRRVAQDAGVSIGGEIFSDALGAPGEIRDGLEVGTYEGMIRYNMKRIVDALSN